MIKKNILIIGPIVDFGGREVMTNLLFHSLKDVYNAKVFSTVLLTKQSVALKGVGTKQWDSLPYYIYRKNIMVKIAAVLTKLIHRRKEPAYFFNKNKLSKPFVNLALIEKKVMNQFLKKADLIIYSDEISGKWLKIIIEACKQSNTPLLFRLTGQIVSVPSFLNDNPSVFDILAHSEQNCKALQNKFKSKVWNIDQTTALEKELLNLSIEEKSELVYGFLGRFSDEKGMLQLIDAFSNNNSQLVIAGDGPYLNKVDELKCKNKKVVYLGKLSPSQIPDFFKKIEVLIIPSFEEGGPIVGVEAMAAGKLIISTKVGAMPERLENTNNDFWFSNSVKNEMQIAINRVAGLTKKERLTIRHQVRDKYTQHNSSQSIQGQYLKVVKSLINTTI